MAPLTSVTFVAFSLCLWAFVLALGTLRIRAEPGQTVTLPCQGHSDTDILAVEWSKTEPWPKRVVFYRDQHSDPEKQTRVALKDKQLNNGDASLILNNVIVNDTGTYECRVRHKGIMSWRRAFLDPEPVSVVVLDVQPDPDSDRERLLLRIMVFIVVCSPYVICTVQVVSLSRRRNAGSDSSDSVVTSPPGQSLCERGDVIGDTSTGHRSSQGV